jgi:NAD(P)-dependent dehydrogenase (short-subunit alcohol dehydrogenase family)
LRDALAGKTALVTGASRGIGAAIARRFAAEGARVAVTARSLEPGSGGHLAGSLQEVVTAIEADGGVAHAIAADLSDATADRAAVVREAEGVFGPLDVLVNNAAACFYIPIEATSEKRLRVALEMNVIAPYLLAQAALPSLRARRGFVLNLTSEIVVMPPGPPFDRVIGAQRAASTYAGSKAALNRITQAMAIEWAPDVGVNALAPLAAVRTEGAAAVIDLPDEACEPMETMVEAALALCTGDAATNTAAITTSLRVLAERDRPVRSLDGRHEFDARPWLARVR